MPDSTATDILVSTQIGTDNRMDLVSKLQTQLKQNNIFTTNADVEGYFGVNTLRALLKYMDANGISASDLTTLNDTALHKLFDGSVSDIADLNQSTVNDVINAFVAPTDSYTFGPGKFGTKRESNYVYPDGALTKYTQTKTPYTFGNGSYGSKDSDYQFSNSRFASDELGYAFDGTSKLLKEYEKKKVYEFGPGKFGGKEKAYQFGPGKFGTYQTLTRNEFQGLSYDDINAADIDKTAFKSYIINVATNTWIPLPVLPESVSEAVSAIWNDTSIIGRSAGYRSYQGTSNRTVNFSLKMHMDLLSELSNAHLDLTCITDYMKALTYPEYRSSELRPPVIILKLADVIKLRGTCDSVNVTYELPIKTMLKYRHKGDLMYSQCSVSLQFTEIPIKAPKSSEIAAGKDFSIKR